MSKKIANLTQQMFVLLTINTTSHGQSKVPNNESWVNIGQRIVNVLLICAKVYIPYIGDKLIPPLIWNPYNGYKPLRTWADDHPRKIWK